jgi:26S proteasome regulatory subunit N4
MGFILPAPYSPREQARTLMARKDGIEAEIDTQLSILRANNATLQSPLVDNQGFPRDDLGTENIFPCNSYHI